MSDFPDYEAAAKTLTELPFDDENDYVQDQARRKAFLAVKAALGDRLLYENIEEHPFSPANAWVEDLVDSGTLARVWPKEADGE